MCTHTVLPPTTSSKKTRFHECPAWQVTAYAPSFLDMEDDMNDPIPVEERFESIDGERIASRDPEDAVRLSRRRLAGSFHEWMRQTFMEEEAARRIQQFVRHRMPSREAQRHDKSSVTFNSDSTLSFMSQDEDDDDEPMQYEVYLWHGSYLGLEFDACTITGLPCVEDSNGNDSLPGMWNLRQGDFLLSINDFSAHKDSMPFDSAMQILEDGVRPAVLRFRRPRIHEMPFRSSASRLSSSSRSMNVFKKEQQHRRERLERSLCYVVWREENGPLGVVFVKPDSTKPYPSVAEVNPNGVVARETSRAPLQAGDLLLSINHLDVSSMGYTRSLEILKFAPRPLVLTFRRSATDYPMARSLEL